jgi:hypothetical protein
MSEEQEVSGKAAGGHARAKALTPERRAEIARLGAEARQYRRSTHEAVLKIGDAELSVAVLEDGTRVLLSGTFMTAMGRSWKGTYRRTGLPNFLGASNLIPFISKDVYDVLEPIEYRDIRGQKVVGYKAELLPLVCEVWLKARDADKLRNQDHIAARAEILIRSLSQVGIVALIDEVTGYQAIRPQDALQAYLEMLIRKELAAWVKRFPDEFYENIYKLKNWPWPGMGKNRFSVVAHYTRDLVYERLAPGVLGELERKTPKNEKGLRSNRLHQWLTDDVGHPMLAQHLHSLILFQRLAIAQGFGFERFKRMVDQVLPKKGSTLELPLGVDDHAATA